MQIWKNKLLFCSILLFAFLLRVYGLDHYPPSLFSDEVSQGYNAYSILLTGHDEYGKYLPVSLRSFGDWKPPLQTYLIVPFIYIFGLNAWSVRLPSAILGTVTVGLFFFLPKLILEKFTSWNKKLNMRVSLLAMIFLCISPWHILQSRSAMLAGIALFFTVLGLHSFFKGLLVNKKYWFVSGIAFVLAIYSYYGMRLIIPLLILILLMFFRKEIYKNFLLLFVASLVSGILLLPLGLAFIKEPNVVFGRARTVSVFYDKGVSLRIWQQIAEDGITMNTKLAQFYHNKPFNYLSDIVRRFFEHLDGRFLFLIGDQNPPFQIPGMGVLYLIDAIFIVIGIAYILKTSPSLFKFLGILVIISILPAAFTYVTPASNRTLTLLLPLAIVTAIGFTHTLYSIRKVRTFIAFSTLMYIGSFVYFIYQYFYIIPYTHADWWHYGYKELVSYVKQNPLNVDYTSISGKASVPYIFYLFYNQIDPNSINKKIIRNYHSDEFGFEHVDQFDNIDFIRYFTWEEYQGKLQSNSLLAVTAQENVNISNSVTEVKKIYFPDGRVAFRLYRIQ